LGRIGEFTAMCFGSEKITTTVPYDVSVRNFNRFDVVHECDGQTDRKTDRNTIAVSYDMHLKHTTYYISLLLILLQSICLFDYLLVVIMV